MHATETIHTTPSVSQEELLSFLLDPLSYPHRPKRVRLIQTHSAYVAIASPYVYKVRKPVNFGFLDFTNLEKRRYFSKREIELNRRLCPEIYLGVVPIYFQRGLPSFQKGYEVIEYAVKMKELPLQYFLKQKLEQGEVGPDDLDRIIFKLKSFYQSRTSKEEINDRGRVEKLKISTDENFRQIEKYIDLTLSRPISETLRFYTDSFYARNTSLFDSRIQNGWIKDCHGDLHLEHIHLGPQSVCIFDCIEFNDRFRYIDIANDIAFLAMDLDFSGMPDLAGYFVARMADVLGDTNMLKIIDFYKCYRATVAGKCENFRSSEKEFPESERRLSAERAQRYFRLALKYAVVGSGPAVLVIMGQVASGKSTLSKRLSEELGWKAFSSDQIRKETMGIPLYKRSDRQIRDQLYSDAMKEKMYERLFQHTENLLKKGRSLILDATFSRRLYRDQLKERIKHLQASCCFIETRACEAIMKGRLLRRRKKVDEVSDARIEDFKTLGRRYEAPRELTPREIVVVDSERHIEETVSNALAGLVNIHLMKAYLK